MHPTTPDGRYFVVKGQLWRSSTPAIPEDVRQRLVIQLMDARREVKRAKFEEDLSALRLAHEMVNA
ncbi:hypothetical protein LNK15_14385, partial [Jeotgalicoccus huakuii]|nr:hypothetical protein [Jeotgalicoccus huakuii]